MSMTHIAGEHAAATPGEIAAVVDEVIERHEIADQVDEIADAQGEMWQTIQAEQAAQREILTEIRETLSALSLTAAVTATEVQDVIAEVATQNEPESREPERPPEPDVLTVEPEATAPEATAPEATENSPSSSFRSPLRSVLRAGRRNQSGE